MFEKLKTLKKQHQIGFGLFLAFGVVSFWRGIWGLSDIFLFPGQPISSYVASIIIGIVVVLVAHYVIEG